MTGGDHRAGCGGQLWKLITRRHRDGVSLGEGRDQGDRTRAFHKGGEFLEGFWKILLLRTIRDKNAVRSSSMKKRERERERASNLAWRETTLSNNQ